MNKDQDDNSLIKRPSVLVQAVAKAFRSQCEAVLHDLGQLEKSVVKIEHGHITERKLGSSLTGLALRSLRRNLTNDLFSDNETTTKNGRTLNSSTVLIRNKKQIPIAALCINADIADLRSVQ